MNGPSVLDRPGRSVFSVEATNDAIGTPLRVTGESVMRAALMDSGMFDLMNRILTIGYGYQRWFACVPCLLCAVRGVQPRAMQQAPQNVSIESAFSQTRGRAAYDAEAVNRAQAPS
jgi:hypothetical protein